MSSMPPTLPYGSPRPAPRLDSARRAGIVMMVLGVMGLFLGVLGMLIVAVGPLEEMLSRSEFAPVRQEMTVEQFRLALIVMLGIVAVASMALAVIGFQLLRHGRKWSVAGMVACAVVGGYMLIQFLAHVATGAIGQAAVVLVPVVLFALAIKWLRESRNEMPRYAVPPPQMMPRPPQQSPWQPGYGTPMAGYYWQAPASAAPESQAAQSNPPSESPSAQSNALPPA